MERLIREGGPTNSNHTTLFVEEEHKSSIIEQGGGDDESGLNCSYESLLLNPKQRFFEQVEEEREEKIRPFFLPNFEDKMPFLQMLQSVESQRPTFSFAQQPYFQELLSRVSTIQHKQQQQQEQQCLELESCITHEIGVVAKEEQHYYCNGESSNEPRSSEQVSAATTTAQIKHKDDSTSSRSEDKRKKRKRTTRVSSKGNKQEAETQRMTHIAVERNRRKQMNDHLNVLRLLMPPSFVQRGDQASIIGGAIDFVKELEQHVQFLEAQKRMTSTTTTTSSSTKPDDPEAQVDENDGDGDEIRHKRSVMMSNGFFTSPQYTTYSSSLAALDEEEEYSEEELKMGVADIQVTVIQSHVNLKILTPRRAGQLLRAIAAFEEMRLTVMHLNVTSFDSSVLYSFNLKIEDGCEVGSADDIAAAVYQIFSYIKQQQQQQLLLAGNSSSGGAQSAPLHM